LSTELGSVTRSCLSKTTWPWAGPEVAMVGSGRSGVPCSRRHRPARSRARLWDKVVVCDPAEWATGGEAAREPQAAIPSVHRTSAPAARRQRRLVGPRWRRACGCFMQGRYEKPNYTEITPGSGNR